MKLIIGNKNYSSWSLRGWLALRCAGLEFDEEVIPLYAEDSTSRLSELSPSGKVPVLIEGDHRTWDSLAIVERANELAGNNALWPSEPHARSHARSIVAEMHSGFMALRTQCPMNIHRKPSPIALDVDLRADLARLAELIQQTKNTFGAGKPFLYGNFNAADVFLAPVCSRLQSYQLPVDDLTAAYRDAVLSHPQVQHWVQAALLETWIIEASEV